MKKSEALMAMHRNRIWTFCKKTNREFMEGNTSKKMEDIRKTLIRLENALNETREQWDK